MTGLYHNSRLLEIYKKLNGSLINFRGGEYIVHPELSKLIGQFGHTMVQCRI